MVMKENEDLKHKMNLKDKEYWLF